MKLLGSSKLQGRNNSLRHRIRRIVTRLRADYPRRMPDFLVIGASRSGTTTLNRILGSHPEVFVPAGELHYFDNDALYAPDLAGYRGLFGGYTGQPVIGEVTPSYCDKGALYDARGKMCTGLDDDPIRRIARAMPDVRLVMSLRDPLSRIRSMYLKNFSQGKFSYSLQEALELERSGIPVVRFLGRSDYKANVENILAHFPRENLKIMIFEEWTRDQARAIPDLFAFLGASPDVALKPVASNDAGRYRKAEDTRTPDPDVSTETRRKLIEDTRESTVWLEKFLGRELPWAKE